MEGAEYPLALPGGDAGTLVEGLSGNGIVLGILALAFAGFLSWAWMKRKEIEERERTKRLEKSTIRGFRRPDLERSGEDEKERSLEDRSVESPDLTPSQRISLAIEDGWRMKYRSPERTLLVKRRFGTRKAHLLLFVFTFWSLGVCNLLYALYKYDSDLVVVDKSEGAVRSTPEEESTEELLIG